MPQQNFSGQRNLPTGRLLREHQSKFTYRRVPTLNSPSVEHEPEWTLAQIWGAAAETSIIIVRPTTRWRKTTLSATDDTGMRYIATRRSQKKWFGRPGLMNTRRQRHDVTSGFTSELARFCWPIRLTNFLETVQSLTPTPSKSQINFIIHIFICSLCMSKCADIVLEI